jgi:hypothetical protein
MEGAASSDRHKNWLEVCATMVQRWISTKPPPATGSASKHDESDMTTGYASFGIFS